jgi:hypothetical protein
MRRTRDRARCSRERTPRSRYPALLDTSVALACQPVRSRPSRPTSGDTSSANLLISYGSAWRLVEVKSASGNASESLVGDLERHLRTWPELRPGQPVDSGILVVNHRRTDPSDSSASAYTRPEFIASIAVPVVSARQLFDWWRQSDWPAIRRTVLDESDEADAQHMSAGDAPDRAQEGAWRRRFGRRLSEDS